MENQKDIRWKQRFENFHKSYTLLERYSTQPITTDIEKAGIIHFFEMTFELGWKVLKDYLEAEGYAVKSPRETIKQAFQIGIIDNGHIWMDALSDRNLTIHAYDEGLADKMTIHIVEIYFPELQKVHNRFVEEL